MIVWPCVGIDQWFPHSLTGHYSVQDILALFTFVHKHDVFQAFFPVADEKIQFLLNEAAIPWKKTNKFEVILSISIVQNYFQYTRAEFANWFKNFFVVFRSSLFRYGIW